MNARRLRLRTIMLMIAALAVVMGVIPSTRAARWRFRHIARARRVEGFVPPLQCCRGRQSTLTPLGRVCRLMFIHDIYALVPLWIIIAAATVVIAPLALVIYRRAAQAGPSQTRGAADPPKPAASNASRQCPTIKKGS